MLCVRYLPYQIQQNALPFRQLLHRFRGHFADDFRQTCVEQFVRHTDDLWLAGDFVTTKVDEAVGRTVWNGD